MSIAITRNNSFRLDISKPIKFCIYSSNSEKKHVITHNTFDKEKNIELDINKSISKRLYRSDSGHQDVFHCQYDIQENHTHIQYQDRETMLLALEKDFPKQTKIITDTLSQHTLDVQKGENSDVDISIYCNLSIT